MCVRKNSILPFLKKLTEDKTPIVISDLDNTIRWVKGPVRDEVAKSISQFRKSNGLFVIITGGPRCHMPDFLIKPVAFCESGAVIIHEQETLVLAPRKELESLILLRAILGVNVEDGPCRILGKHNVIIEGTREATLTLTTGEHPLYPGIETDLSPEAMREIIETIIEQYSLPLHVTSGVLGSYFWIDITTSFKKAQAVECFLEASERPYIYYLGDGINDRETMNLPRVIPVGFKNTISELKELIWIRGGILIEDMAGPDGGVSEALQVISSQS